MWYTSHSEIQKLSDQYNTSSETACCVCIKLRQRHQQRLSSLPLHTFRLSNWDSMYRYRCIVCYVLPFFCLLCFVFFFAKRRLFWLPTKRPTQTHWKLVNFSPRKWRVKRKKKIEKKKKKSWAQVRDHRQTQRRRKYSIGLFIYQINKPKDENEAMNRSVRNRYRIPDRKIETLKY